MDNEEFKLILPFETKENIALCEEGNKYFHENDIVKAHEKYLCAARNGSPRAQFCVGIYYFSGINGRKKDYDLAIKYMKASKDSGYLFAYGMLAFLYELSERNENVAALYDEGITAGDPFSLCRKEYQNIVDGYEFYYTFDKEYYLKNIKLFDAYFNTIDSCPTGERVSIASEMYYSGVEDTIATICFMYAKTLYDFGDDEAQKASKEILNKLEKRNDKIIDLETSLLQCEIAMNNGQADSYTKANDYLLSAEECWMERKKNNQDTEIAETYFERVKQRLLLELKKLS